MNPISLQDFASACRGELFNAAPGTQLTGFALDNREVRHGDLFLAIKGERSDGHDFVPNAMAAGAVAALVERTVAAPHVLVDNLVSALALFGMNQRDKFNGPVIGVTGSNGKTTTKEFVASALQSLGGVLKSPANRNTEYTSPLVWAELAGQKSAVIEMAMRGAGQISHLATIAKPTIGVVTVVGTAHIEKVGSREGIFRAKAELLQALPRNGQAIVWREDDFWPQLNEASNAPVRSFGFSQEADCRVIGYRALSWSSCSVRLSLDGEVVEARLPAVGRHQAQNAAAALLAAHCAGVNIHEAAQSFETADLPPMRLQVVDFQGATILLDTYNASPDSTVAAIQALGELPCDGRRIAVLGEMKELGDFAESGHRMVGKALVASPIDEVFLTGGPTKFIADEAVMAGFPSGHVQSHDELDIQEVKEFLSGLKEGDVALIKGSRSLGLERAVEP